MNFFATQTIKAGNTQILNYLPKRGINAAKEEIITGLISPQKHILPKYFYDARGSELFEKITKLKEYYPTRSEKEILSTLVRNLDVSFNELDIIELGSGDPSKIKTIFSQIPPHILSSINYYPVDISPSAIKNSVESIRKEFNLNAITGMVADFLHFYDYKPGRNKRLFCFFGSTIGNFTFTEAEKLFKVIGDLMKEGDSLLLGLDMVKDISVIEAAYNDSKGITAAFNKNILKVVNHHIQSDFDTADFDHYAFYNDQQQRIEMHLQARQKVDVNLGWTKERISLEKGETIHTENSYKFTRQQIDKIAKLGGMEVNRMFSDEKNWFSLVHYTK